MAKDVRCGGPPLDRHVTRVDQTDTRNERLRNSYRHAARAQEEKKKTLKIRRSLSDGEVER